MSELRWILLVVGVLIVGAVYFLWGRDLGWRARRRDDSGELAQQRREPGFSGSGSAASQVLKDAPIDAPIEAPVETPDFASSEASPAADSGRPDAPVASPETDYSRPESKPSTGQLAAGDGDDVRAQGPQKIVVLHVAGRGSVHFNGEELVAALQAEKMQLGKFEIFHRLEGSTSESMFSAASMIEPGTFDLAKLDDIDTPGISLFLVLPGPVDGAEAFSEMLITARNLAQRLNGEVLDDQGSSLSNQTAEHIREEILSFQLRHRALDDVRA